MLHGDVKPANILMTRKPPADSSAASDHYANAVMKLADFGLAKSLAERDQEASFALSNLTTHQGMIKGTMWCVSPLFHCIFVTLCAGTYRPRFFTDLNAVSKTMCGPLASSSLKWILGWSSLGS
jgi:serine/threonine protein kinase